MYHCDMKCNAVEINSNDPQGRSFEFIYIALHFIDDEIKTHELRMYLHILLHSNLYIPEMMALYLQPRMVKYLVN